MTSYVPYHRRLSGQVASVAASTFVSQALTAVAYLVAARATSPSGYGVVVAAIAVALSVSGFADFGSNALMVRELARSRTFLPEAKRRLWTKVLLMLAAALLGLIGVVITETAAYVSLVVVLAFSTATSLTFYAFARGLHRSDLVAVASVVDRSIMLAGVAAAIAAGVEISVALPGALVVGSTGGVLCLLCLLPAELRPGAPSLHLLNPWRGALSFGVASVAGSLQTLDTAVLGAQGGAVAAGEYGAVSRWTQPVGVLATAYASAAAPFFASAKTGAQAVREGLRSAWWLMLGSCVAFITAVFSDELVELLLGDAYAGSGPVLMWLSLGVALAVWNQPAAVLLQARGLDAKVALVRLVMSVLYLGAIFAIAPEHGALGVAWCFLVLQMAVGLALGLMALLSVRRTSTRGDQS